MVESASCLSLSHTLSLILEIFDVSSFDFEEREGEMRMRRAVMMTMMMGIVGIMMFLSMLAVQYTMFTNQSFEYAANYMEDTGFVALSTIDHVASIGYETYDEEKKRELGRWENTARKCIHVNDIHLTMFIIVTPNRMVDTILSCQ